MTNPKCLNCGLVNFADASECKRCGAALGAAAEADEMPPQQASGVSDVDDEPQTTGSRSILKRVGVAVAVAAVLLVGCYVSLLETSTPADYEQRQLVARAIDIIERSGFERDAFLLRRLANFRTSDSWWNRWLGHQEAYAATNFPFQIVTLYPEFFQYPADDTERAVILLHEARHLAGAGEPSAFASVWRDKSRLGWTRERYGRTRVWRNVGEFTQKYAPEAFSCGQDGQSDCAEEAQASLR
ncbi:MAG TPA: hypothetical protein VGV59_06665 [Pyrinomonadaceae bacterium]|nr:hypothetical protein [Pyrinomonadaceae bacterium]